MAKFDGDWSVPELEAQREDLFRARKARLREVMGRLGMPVLVVLDPNTIRYATGTSNMQLFAQRVPSRYLLLFQDGPAILYEYVGCEHLADAYTTVDEIRAAEGLCMISSGGFPEAAAERFAGEIAGLVRDHDPTIDRIGIDRLPFRTCDALRHHGLELRDGDEAVLPARAVKLEIEIPYLREAMRRVEADVARLEADIEPGRRESEVWAELHFEVMAKQGQFIATRLLQSGPNTYPYFQECGGRKLEAGDLVCLDTDATGYEGYGVDFSRSFLCCTGRASDAQRTIYGRAREQLETNAALLRTGREYRDIAEHAWAIPEEH